MDDPLPGSVSGRTYDHLKCLKFGVMTPEVALIQFLSSRSAQSRLSLSLIQIPKYREKKINNGHVVGVE